MKYHWTSCPNCRCEVTINSVESPEGILGSVRRWNIDRTINDGKPFRLPKSDPPAEGLIVECVCGQKLELPARPDAVSAEREEDFRVNLGE